MQSFNRPVVVALNRFGSDTAQEIEIIKDLVKEAGSQCFEANVWAEGGSGGIDLAKAVYELSQAYHGEINYTYSLKDEPVEKIRKIARNIYGAKDIHVPRKVETKIEQRKKWGISEVPVCMAKTQYSFSDNPDMKGRPENFILEISDIKYAAGAGFMVVYTGEIMTMPGLPAKPASAFMDIDENGKITGLF